MVGDYTLSILGSSRFSWSELIFIIIISATITERLLEGLHRFYWTVKLKAYLVGDDDGNGLLPDGPLREFIRCKFCQSWWVAWLVTWGALFTFKFIYPTEGVSRSAQLALSGSGLIIINTIWIGLVAGSLANKLHDLCHSIKAIKYRGL